MSLRPKCTGLRSSPIRCTPARRASGRISGLRQSSSAFTLPFSRRPIARSLDRALNAIAADPPQALIAFSEGFVVENRETIISFAMKHRLPLVSGWAVMAKSGALLTYGPRLVESYRRTAYFVGRILKGTKPGDLPIEQPTRFEPRHHSQNRRGAGADDPT